MAIDDPDSLDAAAATKARRFDAAIGDQLEQVRALNSEKFGNFWNSRPLGLKVGVVGFCLRCRHRRWIVSTFHAGLTLKGQICGPAVCRRNRFNVSPLRPRPINLIRITISNK